MSETVGFIGLGLMGRPMAKNLLKRGFRVIAHSRSQQPVDDVVATGAERATSPADVARRATRVITMLPDSPDVETVLEGPNGLFGAIQAGTILIDTSTIAPAVARRLATRARELGGTMLDAPVSGGEIGAINATLSIMVGGDADTVARVRPLFELMGKSIVHQGLAGAGQHAKLCNQIVISGTMIGVCESLLYGQRAGLNLETMLQSISGGAASCWALTNLAPRVLKGDFEPGFFIDHFVKDMGIALEECRRMNLKLPGLTMVHAIYQRAQQLGYGRKGTQALYLALEEMNK
jgi:3-hydroxyisobutyrate dehydrogenase